MIIPLVENQNISSDARCQKEIISQIITLTVDLFLARLDAMLLLLWGRQLIIARAPL